MVKVLVLHAGDLYSSIPGGDKTKQFTVVQYRGSIAPSWFPKKCNSVPSLKYYTLNYSFTLFTLQMLNSYIIFFLNKGQILCAIKTRLHIWSIEHLFPIVQQNLYPLNFEHLSIMTMCRLCTFRTTCSHRTLPVQQKFE